MRRAAAAVLGAALLAGAGRPTAGKVTGGEGTLFIGTFARTIAVLDESSEKPVAEIRMRTGIPRRMSLSRDRKRFYVVGANMEEVEVVDVAARAVIDTFKLSEGETRVRIRNVEADPLHRFVILLATKTTRRSDRFEIGPPTLLQYDLASHRVVRTIDWPKKEEREFANMLFSPDGKLLYFFGEDVLIYETETFKEVDRWEISRPLEPGLGTMNFGSLDTVNEEPGFFTGIFRVQDPVQNRRLMGVARVHLAEKSVDFYPLGPATGVSFALAPGRKRAYGLMQQIGRYEFWTFDLENRKLGGRTEFPGRPRMSLKTSTNGKLLYIYGAGSTIDLYEAASYRYLRTITLEADTTTELFVVPPEAPPRPRTF